MSRADTIHRKLTQLAVAYPGPQDANEAHAAVDAMEAENQHLRSLIAAYATEVLRSQPDQDAINAAASALVREVYGQR
jgi:hypothetical protein